jgi:hypothetical protein
MEEIWRDCHLTDKYSISNLGRVRNNDSGKFVKASLDSGYYTVHLALKPKRRKLRVHRLLMFAFNPDSWFEDAVVNHMDCNKSNNDLKNLEWCTVKENNTHAHKNNLITHAVGIDSKSSRLTDNQVLEIRKIYNNNNISQKKLSKLFGVGQRTICEVVNNRRWKHLHWEPIPPKEKISRKGNPNYISNKLTKQQVLEIRKLYPEIKNYVKLGEMFNVSDNNIKKIIQRKTWSHI